MEEERSSERQEDHREVNQEPISALLKRRRKEKGVSLQEAEATTRIPLHYLQHLEGGGDPRLLADELYLVPFLRTYALFLNLDPASVVAEFVIASHQGDAASDIPSKTAKWLLWRRLLLVLVFMGLSLFALFWFFGKQT